MAVYSIKPIGSDVEPVYVKAKTQQQALAHVAKQNYELNVLRVSDIIDLAVLRVSDIVDLAVGGKKIEQANVPEETENGA